MKMKKLLSMGALALVIASSTSVASFAAEQPKFQSLTGEERDIIVAMAKEYKHGDSFLGINKTTTSSAVGIDTDAIKSELENYESGKRLLNHLDLNGNVNDNAHSVVEAIINKCNAANDRDAEFATVKGEIIDVVNDVLAFDKATGTDRADKEAKLKNLLANSEYNVTLGKNSDGATTVSVEKDGTIALQVSMDDAEKIRDILNTLSLSDLEEINAGNNILNNN